MSEQHTPGAMIAVGHWVENYLDSKPDLVTSDGIGGDTDKERCANARRIAACWNACKGIGTDDLERYRDRPSDLSLIALKAVRKHDELQQQVDQFRALAAANSKALGSALAQRDELLAALDGLLNALPSATSHPAIKAAKAARANAMKDEK